MKNFILLLIIFTTIINCQLNPTKNLSMFERQVELHKYFENTKLSLDSSINHIFILQTDKCGSCTDEVIAFITSHFTESSENKIFILSTDVKVISDELKKMPNSTLLIDTNFELGRNGLSYAEDLYFKFNKKKIESWSFLNHSTIQELTNQ